MSGPSPLLPGCLSQACSATLSPSQQGPAKARCPEARPASQTALNPGAPLQGASFHQRGEAVRVAHQERTLQFTPCFRIPFPHLIQGARLIFMPWE